RRRVLRTCPLQTPPLGLLKSQFVASELACMKSRSKIESKKEQKQKSTSVVSPDSDFEDPSSQAPPVTSRLQEAERRCL
ncbi:hypothetical protein, partial [Pseudomonas huaxiensis]|uniref:hypothetical protein n=1 Tax=Pseudomonas huaxiensis TaxID=2213017 RepID=UPI001CDCAB9B